MSDNSILKPDRSNWAQWYAQFYASFIHLSPAEKAVNPESRGPDGALYSDDEALEAALGEEPVAPSPPKGYITAALAGLSAERATTAELVQYSCDMDLYIDRIEYYREHEYKVNEAYGRINELINSHVHSYVFLAYIGLIWSPREKLRVLKEKSPSGIPLGNPLGNPSGNHSGHRARRPRRRARRPAHLNNSTTR